jgi:aspartate-semialdehyde dehydrogenase
MEEVKAQAQAILQGETPPTESFPYPLAFNLFPHNSPLNEQGYCEEEMKMVNETRKIFNAPQLRISATCVRVPVLRAHSEAINLEFAQPMPVARHEKCYLMPLEFDWWKTGRQITSQCRLTPQVVMKFWWVGFVKTFLTPVV